MDIGALFQTLVEKLQTWLETAVAMLPNVVAAIGILLVFGLLAKYVSDGVNRALHRVLRSRQIVHLLGKLLRIGLLATGIFVALSVLGLDKAVTSLLAGVGIVGLALGFAFQDIAANFVSGVLMAIRNPFKAGDLVRVLDHFGRVQEINLRATRLSLLTGETVILPNKDVFQNPITNYTDSKARRVDVQVGVSYGDDLEQVVRVTREAVAGVRPRDVSHDPEVFCTGFGGSSIDFEVRFWIDDANEIPWLVARSDALLAIKRAFDEHGITIPFPIRTLDFGIVGGERLREHLTAGNEAAQ